MIYEYMYFFLGKILILYITIPLAIAWILLGFYVDLKGANVVSAISGPAYFLFIFVVVNGFRSLFPVAIGLGSTRQQFLKSFYAVGAAGIVFCIVILNILQYLMVSTSHQILHPGIFLFHEYHFMAYLWVDLMVGLFLFGTTFLMYSVWHQMGTLRSLILLMTLTISGMFLYYGGLLQELFGWITSVAVHELVVVSLAGIISLLGLLIAYPYMKHARIYPKSGTA